MNFRSPIPNKYIIYIYIYLVLIINYPKPSMRTWCVLLSGLISLQWIIPTSSKVEQWTGGYTHPMFNYTCKFNVGKDVYNLEALERKSPPDYFMDTDDGKRVYVNFCTHLIKNCNGSEGDHNGIVQVWNKCKDIYIYIYIYI